MNRTANGKAKVIAIALRFPNERVNRKVREHRSEKANAKVSEKAPLPLRKEKAGILRNVRANKRV